MDHRLPHQAISLILSLVCLLAAPSSPAQDIPFGGIGFRYDGSGVYPDSKPPTSWSDEQNKNLRWQIATPNWGYGCPVEVGDRVLLMCEPGTAELVWPTLVCFSAKDGSELWRRPIDPLLAFPELTSDQRQQLTDHWAFVHELYRFIYATAKTFPQADEAGRAKIQAKLAEKQLELPGWKKGYGLLRQLKNNNQRYKTATKALRRYGPVITTWQAFGGARIGTCFPTPVTDGETTYVITLYGTAAAISNADGTIKWIKDTGYRQVKHNGLSASPRLADDLFLVYTGGMATAFDKRTGAVAFTHGSPKRYKHGDITSSIVMHLGDTKVWVTPRGEVFRLPDGKLLTDAIGHPNYQSWAYDDATDRVFFSTGGDSDKGEFIGRQLTLEGESVAVSDVFRHAGGLGHMSASFYQGHIYHSARAYDAETGKVSIGNYGKDGYKKAIQYSPKSLQLPVSKHLMLIADGKAYGSVEHKRVGRGNKSDKGLIMVCQLDGKKLADNLHDAAPPDSPEAIKVMEQGIDTKGGTYSNTFNLGKDCVYVRSNVYLWCFGK